MQKPSATSKGSDQTARPGPSQASDVNETTDITEELDAHKYIELGINRDLPTLQALNKMCENHLKSDVLSKWIHK